MRVLEKVKKLLNITSSYMDDVISLWISETVRFMVDAGVNKKVADSSYAVGVVARGVADLYDFGSGSGEFSNHFKQSVIQLSEMTEDQIKDALNVETL